MSDALEYVPRQTSRSVWVFALDVPPAELKAWRIDPEDDGEPSVWLLRDALGLARLDHRHTEVFAAEDLVEYGLSRYLTDANGFDEQSVVRDATRLDALKGPVVLVYSRALGDAPVVLAPRPPLAFIGRYETRPDLRKAPSIHSGTATGTLNPRAKAAAPQMGVGRAAWLIATALVVTALIVLILLVGRS